MRRKCKEEEKEEEEEEEEEKEREGKRDLGEIRGEKLSVRSVWKDFQNWGKLYQPTAKKKVQEGSLSSKGDSHNCANYRR